MFGGGEQGVEFGGVGGFIDFAGGFGDGVAAGEDLLEDLRDELIHWRW